MNRGSKGPSLTTCLATSLDGLPRCSDALLQRKYQMKWIVKSRGEELANWCEEIPIITVIILLGSNKWQRHKKTKQVRCVTLHKEPAANG